MKLITKKNIRRMFYAKPNTIIIDASFNPLFTPQESFVKMEKHAATDFMKAANPNRFDFIFEERAKVDAIVAAKEAQEGFDPREGETEVFRMSPEEGKYYYTAEYTRQMGTFSRKNEHYYVSTDSLTYVGLFLRTMRSGYGDGGQVWSIFERDGEEVRVNYTYEGTTCFVETSAPSEYVFK